MLWKLKKKNYEIITPKLDKNIFQLSEDETADYFRWYMEQVPVRVSYISKVCSKELGIPNEQMNLSPDSLLVLWKWFLCRAETETIAYKAESHTGSSSKIPFQNNRQLTVKTEYIIRDIGMYLGEVFCRNHPAVYWTYYTRPKRDFFVNHPLLKGFTDMTSGTPFAAVFEPTHMTRIQATKILKKTAKYTDLRNVYDIWAEKAISI